MSSLKLQKRLAASVMKCGKNKVWSAFPGNVFLQIFSACPRFMFLILFVYASNVSFVIPKASRVFLLEQSVGSGIKKFINFNVLFNVLLRVDSFYRSLDVLYGGLETS